MVVTFGLAYMAFPAATASRIDPLIEEAARSLIARHAVASWVPGKAGWAWRSVIQSPHYQTDRDVGAASVGMGLLAAYDVTSNSEYLSGARQAGDFLIGAQVPAGSGRWPDFYDPSGPSPTGFTSFDDGAAGIADFLWRLYERTDEETYRTTALQAMAWLESKATGANGAPCPIQCAWQWMTPPSGEAFTGMGQGIAGIGWTFDAFAQRTGDASFEAYALGAATYLESQLVSFGDGLDAMPEQPGTRVFDTGFLSGSAGDAFFFYQLYLSTRGKRWLADTDSLMAWVRSEQRSGGSCPGSKWPIQTHGTGSDLFATGIEEGAAGIGWVELQAVKIHQSRDAALAQEDLLTAPRSSLPGRRLKRRSEAVRAGETSSTVSPASRSRRHRARPNPLAPSMETTRFGPTPSIHSTRPGPAVR